jgi:hypothetical protein
MNDELSMDYIRHFDRLTKIYRVGAWRLLFSNGYGSHLHYDFIDYCWENIIIPYSLPAHITHKMQSLDVVYFQPLKYYHRQAIDKAIRIGTTLFPVTEFFSAFEYIRKQIFKPTTIISAFKQTGIHPWNPEMVLRILQAKPQAHITFELPPGPAPTTPLNPSSNPLSNFPIIEPRPQYFTPKKISETGALGTHIHGLMVQQGVNPDLIIAFEKFRKGAMAGLHAVVATGQAEPNQAQARPNQARPNQQFRQIRQARPRIPAWFE